MIIGEKLTLKASVLSLDGNTVIKTALEGPVDRPRELGRKAGLHLLEQGAAALIGESI